MSERLSRYFSFAPKFGALLSLLLLFAPSLFAQAVSATLVGTVTDASGGMVGNAKITIVETNTGTGRMSATNASGNYTFPSLPPGRYTVTAELTGFKKEVRAGVDVLLDTETRVDLQLQPANSSRQMPQPISSVAASGEYGTHSAAGGAF